MNDRLAFHSLRLTLLAALGLGALACGSTVETGGSGQGGAGASGTTTTTTGQGGASAGCQGATPVLLPDGTDSGYVKCDDGTIHRASVVTCDPTISAAACAGTEPFLNCTTDADCTAMPHGKCIHQDPSFDIPDASCGCVYSCAEDADCGADAVCVCNGVVDNGVPWSRCASSAQCQTDADCASGECGITSFNDGCFQQVSLACRGADDPCRVDADCADIGGGSCVTLPFTSNPGTYNCEFQNCAIGRPLLVEGEARTARTAARSDWRDVALTPDLEGLDPAERQALAESWAEIAALEHASVASFARFTLELMAHGAPPDLLRDAQRAAADEVEHARVAYALASHFGGRSIGPSKLDLSGVRLETELSAMLGSLVFEACVGETLGAAEALSLADMVSDPALRAVYARIAEDEERHAELAWRTLRFLLEGEGAPLREACRDAFDRAIASASVDPVLGPRVTSTARGLPSAAEIGAIRRQALRDVVRPLADAVLGPAILA